MTGLRLRGHPDPVLRTVCGPVTRFDCRLTVLAGDMLEVMYDAPGRGLAAPQVGETQRVFVMDAGWKEGAPTPLICVNPVVDWASEAMAVGEEACLSIPDTPCRVARPIAIDLSWQDTDGTWRSGRMEGVAARIALHELDHLDGILCIDRQEAE